MCEKVEINGPGFIYLTLSDDWIASQVSSAAADARHGVPLERPERLIIDYSAPNVAKEMPVSQLRTPVVGARKREVSANGRDAGAAKDYARVCRPEGPSGAVSDLKHVAYSQAWP